MLSISSFTCDFHGFHLKSVENISKRFCNWSAQETLVVNNEDSRVFMSRNNWSDSCPLEICSYNK